MAQREMETNSRDRYGYIKVNRKVFDGYDDYWPNDRPFSPFEAWLDVIQMAAWKPVLVNGVRLERGQVLVSVRFLSQRWKWEQTRVHRWLKHAKKCERLVQRSTQQAGTVYSLVNYDLYQGVPDPSATPSATRSATQVQHLRNKEEAVKQLSNPTTPSPSSASPTASSKNGKIGKLTWLTPYTDAWKARMGGDPNFGQLGTVMKNLEREHGAQKVLEHWAAYLANPDTPDRVKNPSHFAQKFGLYAPEATALAFPDYPKALVR